MNTADYLPMLNAALITDLIVIVMVMMVSDKKSMIRRWYRQFTLSAVIADVLIMVLGLIIARVLYPYVFGKKDIVLGYFIVLVISVQIVHDLLFNALAISIPRGRSTIMDFFKDYAKENGVWILLVDALMMTSSALIARTLLHSSLDTNILLLIVGVYLVPYLIYSV